MTNRSLLLTTCALLSLAASTPAFALSIVSQAGGGSCSLGAALGGGACSTQSVSVHPFWQGNDPLGRGAEWISYADTGVLGSTLAPQQGSAENLDGRQLIFSVEEVFEVDLLGGDLFVSIWADDTAAVFLDGTPIFDANFSQDICARGSIGCEPGEHGEVSTTLAGGQHTLRIDVFQVGLADSNAANPFGLLYSGQVGGGERNEAAVPTPEPGAAWVFAIGAGLVGRRLRVPFRAS